MRRRVGMIISDDKYIDAAEEMIDRLIREKDEYVQEINVKGKITNKAIYKIAEVGEKIRGDTRGDRFHDIYIFGNIDERTYSIIGASIMPHRGDDINKYIQFVDGELKGLLKIKMRKF